MRNYVVKIRKMSLKNYFMKHCEKQDENFWHTVSPFMSDKKYRNGGNITLNENGETITDASRVSEIFNDFFVNVATDIGFNDDVVSASDAIRRHDQHPSVKRIREYYRDKIKDFDFHVVDTETVMQMIKNINPRKATGCDNIPGKLIWIAYREISIPICSLLNASITAKRFPSIMKYADVSPCFKKEDNLFKGNYRPVSVLTVISKLYESVLNNQMVDHFSELFNILLSAFRKHYNCQSLLLKLIEDIKSALDKGHKTGAVFMDLSKVLIAYPMLYYSQNWMHMASLQPHVNLWVAISIRGCNEWKYQIVEVHGKYWIWGYPKDLFLVPFCSMFLWMIRSFSWRGVIYIITRTITP